MMLNGDIIVKTVSYSLGGSPAPCSTQPVHTQEMLIQLKLFFLM